VFRRPLSLRAREIAQQAGLGLLLLLMLLAFYNDLVRLFLQ
jgi:regulator of sigma E protease